MPEGPEVRITADGLSKYIENKKIMNIYVNPSSRYYKTGLKNQHSFRYPLKVKKVDTKGKKIIIKGKDSGDNKIKLISALGMEGSWKLYPGKHAGIEIHLNDGIIVYFHDTRHFGSFDICLTKDEVNFVLKAVGPDLLKEDIELEDYERVITSSKIKHKEICWFLMEQKYFSGVGNYLLAEILYACKIHPARKLGDLSENDIKNLLYYSKKLIRNSYKCGGLTIATYFSMADKPGVFVAKIYGQRLDPLGNSVLRATFSNGRTSHYVPNIQI